MSYEVVLADGSLITASASANADLWRALKGGASNFGIVTRFTLRSLPSKPVWSGSSFLPGFEHKKALKAFHDYLRHASSGEPGAFDENAAGPIVSSVYIQSIGLRLTALHLAYTKAPSDNMWPTHWRNTGFRSLWSLYSSFKVQSHTSAVAELGKTSLPGSRHTQGTTTIRNDLETLAAANAVFGEATTSLRNVKGLLLPFVLQAVLPEWMNKGDPNVLGLEGCAEPLIILSFSAKWAEARDDEVVRSAVRRIIEQIEAIAATRQTGHPYRFMNYCTEWQRPFDGRGDKTLRFMRDVSRTFDPDGLFQRGYAGGFKLSTELEKE